MNCFSATVVVGQAALTLLSVFLAYKYGRSVEKNERESMERREMSEVRRLRASLGDPDVANRLHGRFKR